MMIKQIGIVIARFHASFADVMLESAKKTAETEGLKIRKIISVAGVFDIPLQVQGLLKDKGIDGVAALGVVVQGVSDHDILVTRECSRALVDLSLRFEKPVTLGIIGPRITMREAEKRLQSYAQRAILALNSTVE